MKFTGKYKMPRRLNLGEMIGRAALLFLLLVGHFSAASQPEAEKDTTLILLADRDIQLECTQGLNDLYNFRFDDAEAEFRDLKIRYGWHPLPYFLMGLSDWWKIMPNTQNTQFDESFLAYMDTTIQVAQRLYDDYPAYKAEAAFFLAAAYGFKGRLYSDEERKNFQVSSVKIF